MDWLGASPTWGQLIVAYVFLVLVLTIVNLAKER